MSEMSVAKLSLRNLGTMSDRDMEHLAPIISKKSRRVKKKNLKRKIQHEWSENEVISLIKAVKQQPSIWMDGALQQKLNRSDCWNSIIAALAIDGVDVNEAKTKWASLRVTYRLNLSKMQSAGLANTSTVVWRYFELMSFLDQNNADRSHASRKEHTSSPETKPFTETRPSRVVATSIKRRRTRGNASYTASTTTIPLVSTTASTSLGALPSAAIAPGVTTPLPSPTGASQSPARSSSSKSASLSAPAAAALQAVAAAFPTAAGANSNSDANSAFCEYLLSEMRTISSDHARSLRHHLSRTLLQFLENVKEADQMSQ
ncbi:uncharacterized protein LOC115768863 [Drosophila novamexicana]|uniref:uncharacterized protein LOC115768863 n=1 Tax=Drosophila novamexicana TaxID=47314 RepID=UPI0011E5B2B2|nr:uncharacterized protein LOC115768863 [Drosophila novamexicana]